MPFTLIPQNSISGGVGDSLRTNAKPLIINGDMAVAQRGTSFVSEGEQYTLDRFYYEKNNDAVVTITQEALTSGNAYKDGFSSALKVDVTTADTNFTTNQRAYIEHTIEGQDLQLVKKGTSDAEKLTLAFWVKATKTGTNVVRIDANDSGRVCSQSYTISSSDTWEKKVLNFPADTTGVINNDNGKGLRITWGMASGTNYTSGTLATTWEAETDANTFVGQVNNFDSASNNFHITGIQLEVGEYTSSTLPPFQHESYGDNFLRCQRYCQQFNHDATGGNETQVGIGWAYNSSSIYGFKDLVIPMRTQPTMSSLSGTNYYRTHNNNTAQTFNQIGFNASSTKSFWIFNAGTFSGLATNQIRTVEIVNANGYVRADAEL